MVFKDQCKLPARSPGSSRQAPLPEDFGNRFQFWQEGKAQDICQCLMNFVQAFKIVALGNFEILEMANFSILKNNVTYCEFTFTKFQWQMKEVDIFFHFMTRV